MNGQDNPRAARWFSVTLDRATIPWAYARGDPFRAIASLELLGTLLCVLAFQPDAGQLASVHISFSASGDNKSNGYSLEKLSSTKYPLCLVLMELAHQLRKRRCLLDVAWRPREENEEADALTNWQYGAFDVAKRIPVVWEQLPLEVLPRLAFVRPFLGPLYGWSAVVNEQSAASIPPMVKQVLLWIADQFDRKERVAFGVPVRR